MNRTMKEATVQRFHCQSSRELNEHLQAFLLANNHAKRLETLRGLTPQEFVCAQWQKNPATFVQDPTHLTLGLCTQRKRLQQGAFEENQRHGKVDNQPRHVHQRGHEGGR